MSDDRVGDLEAEIERLRALCDDDLRRHRVGRATVDALIAERDEARRLMAVDFDRARAAEDKVAAVLALCDEWEAGPWSWLKDTAAPRIRAVLAVDGKRGGAAAGGVTAAEMREACAARLEAEAETLRGGGNHDAAIDMLGAAYIVRHVEATP